jgi:hypothetical protein
VVISLKGQRKGFHWKKDFVLTILAILFGDALKLIRKRRFKNLSVYFDARGV